MTIQVIVNGADQIGNELLQVPKELERTVLLRMSQAAYDEAQRGAGRHVRTGAMFQSLYNRSVPNGREVGHDTQRAPHAVFVQFGTRPHVIEPSKKKALRWAVGGRFQFATRVNHPGYRGDAYMVRAADEAVRQFATIVDAAWKESIK